MEYSISEIVELIKQHPVVSAIIFCLLSSYYLFLYIHDGNAEKIHFRALDSTYRMRRRAIASAVLLAVLLALHSGGRKDITVESFCEGAFVLCFMFCMFLFLFGVIIVRCKFSFNHTGEQISCEEFEQVWLLFLYFIIAELLSAVTIKCIYMIMDDPEIDVKNPFAIILIISVFEAVLLGEKINDCLFLDRAQFIIKGEDLNLYAYRKINSTEYLCGISRYERGASKYRIISEQKIVDGKYVLFPTTSYEKYTLRKVKKTNSEKWECEFIYSNNKGYNIRNVMIILLFYSALKEPLFYKTIKIHKKIPRGKKKAVRFAPEKRFNHCAIVNIYYEVDEGEQKELFLYSDIESSVG